MCASDWTWALPALKTCLYSVCVRECVCEHAMHQPNLCLIEQIYKALLINLGFRKLLAVLTWPAHRCCRSTMESAMCCARINLTHFISRITRKIKWLNEVSRWLALPKWFLARYERAECVAVKANENRRKWEKVRVHRLWTGVRSWESQLGNRPFFSTRAFHLPSFFFRISASIMRSARPQRHEME